MDTGDGYFQQFESVKEMLKAKTRLEQLGQIVRGVFEIGERFEIRGSEFEVWEIWPKKLVLKLIKPAQ